MRRLTLVLALALLSSGFAPAPVPRPARDRKQDGREALLREYRRRLDGLGVKWRVEERDGKRAVRFSVRHPREAENRIAGYFAVSGEDLPGTLRRVIERVERFVNTGC